MSVESSVPSLPAPGLPMPSLPPPGAVAVIPTPTLAASTSAAPVLVAPVLAATIPAVNAGTEPGAPHALPTLPAAPTRTKPGWKPIQRSKARKALNGLIGVAVFAALAFGAWFVYQSLAPVDDTTTPTTLLIDNPDTFVGQANAAVNQVNAQAPDQEVLDLLGVEAPASPPAPDAPAITTAP
jgi:hypothetical protein